MSIKSHKHAVIITGSSGGLGRSISQVFKDSGYFVVGIDRADYDEFSNYYIKLDLGLLATDKSICDNLYNEVCLAINHLPLKCIVNNAAVQILKSYNELDYDDWSKTININLLAPFTLIKLFANQLKNASGSVINISSIHAKISKPNFVCYATSKAALSGMTRSLSLDLAPEVRVNAIELAATETQMLLDSFNDDKAALNNLKKYHPLNRIAKTFEVARSCLFLASDDASFITGTSMQIDGGIGSRLHDPS